MNIVNTVKRARNDILLGDLKGGVTFKFCENSQDVYLTLSFSEMIPGKEGSLVRCVNLRDNRLYNYSMNSQIIPIYHEVTIDENCEYSKDGGFLV